MIWRPVCPCSTNRIDDAVSAKLQACCINFNDAIKGLFGTQYALERRLPIALQFVTFSLDQRAILKKARGLPRHIETMMNEFEERLTPEQQNDPRYAHRIYMIPKTANRDGGADFAVELIPLGSELDKKFNIVLKDAEKDKYRPSDIVEKMKVEGWDRFSQHFHTKLWKRLDAKNPKEGYGVFVVKTWYWYETWLNRVREECAQHPQRYQSPR